MIPQQSMIHRLRQVCLADERLLAAMLYGSFACEEGDAFSDIDAILYFADADLPAVEQPAWVSQIAPVWLYYHNEFGSGVAIFANLVRAEFHFEPASDIPKLAQWRGVMAFPTLEGALLVDKTGALSPHLRLLVGPPPNRRQPGEAQFLCQSFLNWFLFGVNVCARGEAARGLEILHLVQDYLLRMARLLQGQTAHWVTPTRALEQEILPASYARLRDCTAPLASPSLWRAYAAAWDWGSEMMAELIQQFAIDPLDELTASLDHHLRQHMPPGNADYQKSDGRGS